MPLLLRNSQEQIMGNEEIVELLGRAAALEYAIGSVIRHLPTDAREAVQEEIRLFLERSDLKHDSGKATAAAARSILKESGDVA
ncbi:MAG TPA: hypothetical protein VGC09_02320 [Rhodopila sp.]